MLLDRYELKDAAVKVVGVGSVGTACWVLLLMAGGRDPLLLQVKEAGVKKFRVVFVFDNVKAFNSFVNSGWQFGGQSTAAAKVGDKGGSMAGAVSVSDGVWMYQLTDKGLALEITTKSTKYYKDGDLN